MAFISSVQRLLDRATRRDEDRYEVMVARRRRNDRPQTMHSNMPTRDPVKRRDIENALATAFADCQTVIDAAQALQVKEFDFFRLAYRRWFGRQPDEKQLEKLFVAYMMRRVVPPWARHLSREVVDHRRRGTLDASAYGAPRYRERVARHPRGPLYFAGVMAIWLALFSLLLGTRYDAQTSAPPPLCPASSFLETWVHLISGRPDVECREQER